MRSDAVVLPAAKEHLAQIAALARVVWQAHYPGIISQEQIEYMLGRMYDLAVMEAELANGIRYDRVLLRQQLAGFASYGPAAPSELKLHKLYIDPQHQRCGLGTLLLEHVVQHARDSGFSELILSVNKANSAAIAAYQKNGFVIRNTVTVDIGGGFVMDDFVMERRLRA